MNLFRLRDILMTLLIALGLTAGTAGVAMADGFGEQDTQQDDYERVDWGDDDSDDEDDDYDW
jgi:hypothetical protein